MESRRTVNVYVDGFSLYYALLKRQYPQLKWLDLRKLSEFLYPERDVSQVKYFTAALKPTRNDPGIGQRQQVYWRALQNSGVEIVEGNFMFSKQYYPFHPEQLDLDGNVMTVKIRRPEEKGTDVALASHLILDALDNEADSFAVVTNDSDLVTPMREIARRGADVSLISVAGPNYNKAFVPEIISSVRQIREGTLAASQFEDRITLSSGLVVSKPKTWI